MRKLVTILLAMASFTAFGATNSTAKADVTIKGDKPFVFDLGISILERRSLLGLAQTRAVITLVADANVRAECTSPGGTTSKSVTADPISVIGGQNIPRRLIVNGEAKLRIVTIAPDLDIEGAPDCPNSNWTETIVDLAFTQTTLTVQQPFGTVVLTKTCTFSPPTADGFVPLANYTCN